MVTVKEINKHLPLSEATYYIMLMLVEPRHGYSVMQHVDGITKGGVKIGPGTLYGAFSTLEKDGLIEMMRKDGRRKVYALTVLGKGVLLGHYERLELMMSSGQQIVNMLEKEGA